MFVTPAGMVTLIMPLPDPNSANASSPMLVTGYPFVMAGMTTLSRRRHYSR
jgi:hypothetical protein